MHESSHWRLERRPAPRSVAEALGLAGSSHIGLDIVRGPELAAALRSGLVAGGAAVVDGENDADLLATVAAADSLALEAARDRPVAFVGTAALAAAVARHHAPGAGNLPGDTPLTLDRRRPATPGPSS
ncbi:hypothetical protein GCM10025867_42670 [Frondihabitans sucicola]|uniref:Uncharacterized protein n=1 Tax=Frondihabitans sucicola TaxID=1268041 RepID=A0ABN6Y4K9_9MICO|nr:hypothetical protein [Frondihabitans sucicola]BDZ52026.1 hypothetical protein GCM10025867_42670 [Frondihabitans sucicola]